MATSATLTTTHLPKLRSLLKEWTDANAPSFKTEFTTAISQQANVDDGEKTGLDGKDVIVAFRTRPPLEHEEGRFHAGEEKFAAEENGDGHAPAETDVTDPSVVVEFCSGITLTSTEPGAFVAHVPGWKWSGPTLAHKFYESDLAFGPNIHNEEVYQRTVVANDLVPLALSGGVACILAYGQTGSGKTFTMEGIEHAVARDLFETAKATGKRLLSLEGSQDAEESTEARDGSDVFEFQATFLELMGKTAVDLVDTVISLDEEGNPIRKEIAIREDKIGDIRPNLIATKVSTSSELNELITKALAHRRTSPTTRNPTSSRSHALLSIRVKNTLIPYAQEGQLLLVDLAGSERYEDSKEHTRAQMEESRENNKALMNLKECVRAKAKLSREDGFVHVPFRSNKLTMVLKPLFDIESSQISKAVIIAHVSPHLQDTIHSSSTLAYAAPFKLGPPKRQGPITYDASDPRTWDHEKTKAFFTKQFVKHARARRTAKYKVRVKHAEVAGKKVAPLADIEDSKLKLLVDLDKLCRPGETALQFGKMYTSEFVERCLLARSEPLSKETDNIKSIAVEVIGQLFYLLLTAKTRKRNEIMKSRRIHARDEIYGPAPIKYIEGTTIPFREPEADYSEKEVLFARGWYGPKWPVTVGAAWKKAKEENKSEHQARGLAVRGLMEGWVAAGRPGEPKDDGDGTTHDI